VAGFGGDDVVLALARVAGGEVAADHPHEHAAVGSLGEDELAFGELAGEGPAALLGEDDLHRAVSGVDRRAQRDLDLSAAPAWVNT
jgi:hypothetical protein